MKIEVCERMADFRLVPQRDEQGRIVVQRGIVPHVHGPKYHAQIEPGLWACGDTADDAIGNLIRTHPEKFGVTIEFLGKLPR
jgi:hypothetical protein